jgi:short-chain fatty acids transporter
MPSPNVAPNADERRSDSLESRPRTILSSVTSFFLFLFERITPDPYIFAVALTILTALLAAVLAPKGSADIVLTGWYNGLFTILAFAFQMVLVLVTGYALSNSPPVKRLLDRLAGIATTPKRAVVVLILTVMATSFVNWGCGLVVAGLLAREIAKKIRVDFGWLVAAAYSGWIIWASGLSSSIALAQATPGSILNIVQKITGNLLPLNATVFAPFNLVPVLVLAVLIPILYCVGH